MRKKIIAAIVAAGGEPFYVGGYVRDAYLNLPSKDIDIEVYGLTMEQLQEALKEFNPKLVGKSFGVLLVEGMDISLPRKDTNTGKGHKGFEVAFDPFMHPREAASRRDFTMNSLMLNATPSLIRLDHILKSHDYFKGQDDMRAEIIRHVDDKHFSEDPLRALRAVQFAVRFGFTIAPETAALCKEMDLSELPNERIWEEMYKFLVKGRCFLSHGIDALDDTNMWRVFPDLFEMFDTPQDPIWHPEGDVLTHTMMALDYANENFTFKDDNHKFKIMLAILLHDVGKPATTCLNDKGRISSKGHAKVGADLAREFIKRYATEAELIDEVPKLVYDHMFQYSEKYGDSAIRRLAMRVNIEDLMLVADADSHGSMKELIDKLQERAEYLEVNDGKPLKLVEYKDLGIEINPPPERGKAINELFEAQLDGKFTTKEEGIKYFETLQTNK